MKTRNRQDMLAGALLFSIGLFMAVHAVATYPLGTIRNMQAGMFPLGVGSLLSIFGLAILLGGVLSSAPMPKIEWRSLLAVAASVGIFALLLHRAGLLCAVAAASLTASLANSEFRPVEALVLAASLAALSAVIFHFGLGLQAPLLP